MTERRSPLEHPAEAPHPIVARVGGVQESALRHRRSPPRPLCCCDLANLFQLATSPHRLFRHFRTIEAQLNIQVNPLDECELRRCPFR